MTIWRCGYGDPFGPARGPGGVDDVGQVIGDRLGHRIVVTAARYLPPVRVEADGGRINSPQPLCCQRSGDSDVAIGVLYHVGQALSRVGGIQWQVCAACLQHAEQAYDHPEAALHEEPDFHLRPHAHLTQVVRELIRSPVERFVRELLAFVDHRHGVWRLLHLLLEQLVNAAAPRVISGRLIPIEEDLLALLLTHHRQVNNTALLILGNAFQQQLEV